MVKVYRSYPDHSEHIEPPPSYPPKSGQAYARILAALSPAHIILRPNGRDQGVRQMADYSY